MSKYDFMKFSNATREIIKEAKLGDAVYTIIEVEGAICECCSQRIKSLAIKKVYVGRIEEEIDGGRRITMYRETPAGMKGNRYGMSEFYPVAVAFYGTGSYLALNKDDLIPELEHKLKGNKELDEFVIKRESEDNG